MPLSKMVMHAYGNPQGLSFVVSGTTERCINNSTNFDWSEGGSGKCEEVGDSFVRSCYFLVISADYFIFNGISDDN